jgi:hypothetical protein
LRSLRLPGARRHPRLPVMPVWSCSCRPTASGPSTGPCALPEVTAFQTLTSDSIYAVYLGEVLSVSAGTVSWTSGDPMSDTQEPILQGSLSQFAYSGSPTTGLPAGAPASGAVAGNRMVFASGHYVLAQGY